jgi:uncharacterized protein
MRKVLAVLALLCAFAAPAAALDFPALDGRVVDDARLFDDARLHTLEGKLADLEARTSRQLMVVTLASAPDMTVEGYGLELRKHWQLAPNGKRVALIVSPHKGRSVIQFDRALNEALPESVTNVIFQQLINPRFNSGDFAGGVTAASEALIKVLGGETLPDMRPAQAPQRFAQSEITVPATPEFPALSGRVVDDAGVLDSSTREALRAKLAAHEVRTGNQIVVATVRSLHGNSVEEYANRLFRRWQLGQKGVNNGVLLLHALDERKIRIEVGYGPEGTLTDAISKFIIQNDITPRFKAGDFAGGMTRAVDDIIKVLSGDEEIRQRATAPQPIWSWSRMTSQEKSTLFFLLPLALIIIGLIVMGALGVLHEILVSLGLAKKRPRKGFWHGVDRFAYSGSSSSSSSSWGSSSSSSSDSFSGGGGDSGGGGASGDY